MPVLHLDIETRSAINLERVSTRRYAVDETTEVLCAAYGIDNGPIGLWTPGTPIPGPFNEIAIDPEWRLAAHNTNFEFSILRYLLAPRFNWPSIPIDRFICTMAMARASALPGSLDGAASALGLAAAKDKAGAKLMKEIATRKREPTPEDLERLHAYCRQDVEVERELFRRLPQLAEAEQTLWVLDHKINQRGIPIDRELAIAIATLATNQRSAINAEIAALTCGKVMNANQRDKIIKYLCANGCEINSLTKADVNAALENDVGDGVRKLLELRAVGCQAAASKVGTLLNGLDSDDRLRETLVYHGAATGRWTGRRFQPQNLRKPNKALDVDAAIAAIKSGELSCVEALGAPLSIAADVSRGLICARPGYALIGADFSAIESRVLAWLADEKWKLASYRQFDETNDPAAEPYCLTASKIFKRTVTPADEEDRAVGKVADLAGGFGGGVGAWRRFAPNDTRDDATIKADISAWRKAHPRIVRFWSDLEHALKRAIRRPGKRFQCGRLSAECHEGTLFMTLPSGRGIAYPQARLVKGKFEDSVDIAFKDNEHGKWTDVTEWYGTFVENAVSGTARDLLAAALMRLEAAGFPIVAHVHDEAIAEIHNGDDRREEFLTIMTIAPPWADGLPIAGKAWMGPRFIKSEMPAAPAIEEIPIEAAESEPVVEQAPPWEGKCRNRYAADHKADVGKPYAPVRAKLLERGYRLVKSFPFTLPGDAEPLFFEDRYEKTAKGGKKAKECRFRHVKDGIELCDTGPRRILYGLRELARASLSMPVFVTEGAGKCDPLITAGVVAVAAPYHTFKDECATALAGRHLIYLEDHDLPDANGRIPAKEFSDQAGRQLSRLAASFRVVPAIVLWNDLGRAGKPPHGWDVKDWIEGGGKAGRLDEICKNEPETEAIDPIDLWGHFDPPPLLEGLLPAAIEEFAKEEADTMGTDPAGLAMAALTVCAAALPDRAKLQVKKHNPHWKESARLWTALVGSVSTKKTPIIDRATPAIKKIDWDLAREHEAALEAYDQLTKEEQKRHKPPTAVRLVIEDTTIEAAQEVFKGNCDGVLKVHDELAGFFGAMERYNGRAGNTDRAFYLQAYNGGHYVVDRIKRGPFRIENLSISVLGGAQPDLMRRIAAESVDDGLIQRLVPIMLRDAEAGKDVPSGRAGARYDALVANLRNRETPPAPLQFDDAARAVREDLEWRHLRLQRYYANVNKRLAAHIGKYDGLFARMCLLWHHIEGANASAVTERTAHRVADFMHKFLLPHAVAFYTATLGVSDNHDSVSQVAGYILARKLTRVTSRDIQSGIAAMSGLKRQDVEVICDQLESLGWLFRVQGPRRDSAHWDVNPEVHGKFAERAAREAEERAARRASIVEAAAEGRAHNIEDG